MISESTLPRVFICKNYCIGILESQPVLENFTKAHSNSTLGEGIYRRQVPVQWQLRYGKVRRESCWHTARTVLHMLTETDSHGMTQQRSAGETAEAKLPESAATVSDSCGMKALVTLWGEGKCTA